MPKQKEDRDEMREEFERWMVEDEKCVIGSSDPYAAGIERRNWSAWQRIWKARKAITQRN